jgi:spore coat polysaccharide biosynthesis predicted glycosyltransferase SpsG
MTDVIRECRALIAAGVMTVYEAERIIARLEDARAS